MEPHKSENLKKENDFAFTPAVCDVKYSYKRTYEDVQREIFQPSQRQMQQARSWLVRVVARRAVDILKAQETGP